MKKNSRVWFNKGFSSLYSIFQLIREADQAGRFHLYCTHSNAEFVGFLSADSHEVEPVLLKDDDYLAYCLEQCRSRQVEMFMPARRMNWLIRHRGAFEAIGVKLLAAADAATLSLLDNKAGLYDHLRREASGVLLPGYEVVQTLEQFDAAVARLTSAHERICVKPVESVFGLGFRILTDKGDELSRLLNGDTLKMGREHLRAMLAAAGSFRPIMVMQYLEGHERSIDCLADKGELIRCVIRLKPLRAGAPQLLEDNPEIADIAASLTRQLKLDGMFNIQLKESGGAPYLLEINPRMSGGLPYACFSGLTLPYWALRLAQGSCRHDEVPRPRTGLRVAQITCGVLAGE